MHLLVPFQCRNEGAGVGQVIGVQGAFNHAKDKIGQLPRRLHLSSRIDGEVGIVRIN